MDREPGLTGDPVLAKPQVLIVLAIIQLLVPAHNNFVVVINGLIGQHVPAGLVATPIQEAHHQEAEDLHHQLALVLLGTIG